MNFLPPPATLREFWDESIAVVHVIVRETGLPQRDPGSSERAPRAVRLQKLTVREVLKPDPDRRIGEEIEVKQYGGTLVVNGREQATAYAMEIFRPGEEYVLFLSRAGSGYSIRAADAGAFRIDPAAGRVQIPQRVRERMPAFETRSHLSVTEFFVSLRGLQRP
jgi:hypothetical protein